MTNYLVYGRVSTSRQAERELSIPAQVKACQKYGMDHHWTLAPDGIYEEKGESARTVERPQLQKMLHRAKTDAKIDVILMHKLDRMCRNVADYAAIKMMLKKHDVRLISVVEQFDESFSGELVENIMSSIAQWTSQNISWEVKKVFSTFKLGGSNLISKYNYQAYGGPGIGRMIYGSILFDINTENLEKRHKKQEAL